MITLLHDIFVRHWQRKLIAILVAAVIWGLVNHTITVTRTISNIPVRVLNVPEGKTVEGMSPDGLLSRRITLTLTGARNTLQRITPQDLEAVTDAAGKGDQWTIEITKRNLRSANTDINIAQGITDVAPVDLTVQLSPLVTALVPVTITAPVGEPPAGYRYLDVWPQKLTQKVSGPEKQVEELKAKGLKLTFDLSEIPEEELAGLNGQAGSDEIRLFVPASWKRVSIPFLKGETEELNDPEAAFLHITLLKKELIPLGVPLPLDVFYPLKYSEAINPETYPLAKSGAVRVINGVPTLKNPVLVGNVSRLFVDTVRGNARVILTASPKEIHEELAWSVEIVNPRHLEDNYVLALMSNLGSEQSGSPQLREEYLRSRFRNYMSGFALYSGEEQKLELRAELSNGNIVVQEQ